MKDPYSSPAFTARQERYSNRYGFDGVYTPQLAVDGWFGFVGSSAQKADSAIAQAAQALKMDVRIVDVQRENDRVSATISTPTVEKRGHGDLYVALADERVEAAISGGENSGRTLSHVAVVLELRRIGDVTAKERQVLFKLPHSAGAQGWRVVAFVQDEANGRILGAAQQKLR